MKKYEVMEMDELNYDIKKNVFDNYSRVVEKKKIPIKELLMFVVGVCFMSLSTKEYVPKGSPSYVVCTIGVAFIMLAVGKLLSGKKVYMDSLTQYELEEYCIYLAPDHLPSIKADYMNKDFKKLITYYKAGETGLMLHLFGTIEGGVFYSVLMKYVPYQFIPIGEVQFHEKALEVHGIVELIRRGKV